MNTIGGTSAVPTASQSPAVTGVEAKRGQLQAQLLRKMLEMQNQQATAVSNEQQGKGQVLDIRV